MKNYSVSWEKEPETKNLNRQIDAIFKIYDKEILNGIKPNDLYLSVSQLLHDKLAATTNPLNKSVNPILAMCTGITISVNKKQSNYCLELKRKMQIETYDLALYRRQYSEAMREYKNIQRRKQSEK